MATGDKDREFRPQTASHIMKHFHSEGTQADVHFVFESNVRIAAHKNVLIAASDVFRPMFDEKANYKENTTKEIEIEDATPEAFATFLQFIYYPVVTMTMANVDGVVYLAKKYGMTECFDMCAKYLNESINIKHVCSTYEIAKLLGHEKLQETCSSYISKNAKAIFASNGFLNSKQETVKRILQLDLLYCPEIEVLKALMEWIKVKTGHETLPPGIVKGQFSDLRYRIKYGLLKFEEFAAFIGSYPAQFTADEYEDILQMIQSDQYESKIFKRNGRLSVRSDPMNQMVLIFTFECL